MQKLSYKINNQGNSESGAYIVTLMIILFGLLMMLSLAVDSSLLYLRNLQFKFAAQAASSAALAGQMSRGIYAEDGNLSGTTTDTIQLLAENIIQANIRGMKFHDPSRTPGQPMPAGSYSVKAIVDDYEENEQLDIEVSSSQTSIALTIIKLFNGSTSATPGGGEKSTVLSGSASRTSVIQPANIVLILDVSGSMLCEADATVADPLTSDCNDPIPPGLDVTSKRDAEDGRRIGALKDAVRSFLGKFNPSRHKIAIIPFSFAAWQERQLTFGNPDTSSPDNWFNAIDRLDTGTYTNPTDAFHQILSNPALNTPNTIFVFFTDGAPQSTRLLLSRPRQEPAADAMPSTHSGSPTVFLKSGIAEMDYLDWPAFVAPDNTTPALPADFYSPLNRPNYLANYHTTSELPDVTLAPDSQNPSIYPPRSNTDSANTPRYHDYYHYTEDCFAGPGDAADGSYNQYNKEGSTLWIDINKNGTEDEFRCPSALIRTPPDTGRFRLVSRGDRFFKFWPAAADECIERYQSFFGPIDTTGFVNINCENIWLNNDLKPLMWNLFAPCSVHRAAYWDSSTGIRRTTSGALPVAAGADGGAPYAFANCVQNLSFYLPGTGGAAIESSEIPQSHVLWNQYPRVYYHSAIALADSVRNSGRLIYVIGLGPDPEQNNVKTSGGDILPYNNIDNDFERKDFFLARVALDPFIIPYTYATSRDKNPTSRELEGLELNVDFNVAPPDLNTSYTWDSTVSRNRLYLGEYVPVSNPDSLTQVFDRIARKILLARLR